MTRIRNEFKAGAFVIVALSLLGFSILAMGRERQIFVPQVEYFARFKDSKGLSTGAPIRLGGIKIGRVGGIAFPEDPADPDILVNLLINEPYIDRLRKDSRVIIETQGLLGDRYLNISGGHSDVKLPIRSEIEVEDTQEISAVLGKVQSIVDDTSVVARDLTSITGKVKEEGVEKLVKVFDSFSRVLGEVEMGKGLAHELVYGVSGKDTLEDIRLTAQNLKLASADILDVTSRLNKGPGILQELIDQKGSGHLAAIFSNLASTARDMALVSEALAKGSGTVGALIMDSGLYDNLVEVTDEAKRSFILRQAIRATIGSDKKQTSEH